MIMKYPVTNFLSQHGIYFAWTGMSILNNKQPGKGNKPGIISSALVDSFPFRIAFFIRYE